MITSTTGQQWEPSLSPMSTMRYDTMSVSTTSPEMLVVAGGRGSDMEDLDTVKVLMGQKCYQCQGNGLNIISLLLQLLVLLKDPKILNC